MLQEIFAKFAVIYKGEKNMYMGMLVATVVLGIGFLIISLFVVLLVLLIKALIKYIKSEPVRQEKDEIKKSLGEVLKQHREECKMTQEFVAEAVGVSRQAVSKWENGTSDPSTSNLLALAKLYKISPEELINQIK